ncbi:MAG TPA: alpha-ketoglutarate-dependent dioxygenase AlkB [Allosphingosinicella sp.]|nr:alpha-ketoglutarate-dependent dioxygenase AlkB [Allosphingosinicella sp.]
MSVSQPSLFAIEHGPEGFRYAPELLSREDETALIARMKEVPFRAFAFHGFEGKRRTHSYGWRYVFDGSGLQAAEPIPEWLFPARAAAARWAGVAAERFEHALFTEYEPGAAIGWHRDRSVFGEVIGLSLLSAARMRFRRKVGTRWERLAAIVEPGSAYLLSGPARTEWEHSIPPAERLRYSITFRTMAAPP